jgi:hypothetical protein
MNVRKGIHQKPFGVVVFNEMATHSLGAERFDLLSGVAEGKESPHIPVEQIYNDLRHSLEFPLRRKTSMSHLLCLRQTNIIPYRIRVK